MKLFGSVIGWKANKQDTVTTSTTKTKLLTLSQAAKEGQYVSRLLRELTVELDDNRIEIQCDNTYTIRLVNQEITRLQTELRHVDIHNHWLRQEVLLCGPHKIKRYDHRRTNESPAERRLYAI